MESGGEDRVRWSLEVRIGSGEVESGGEDQVGWSLEVRIG